MPAILSATNASSEENKTPLRKIGGFLCVDLKPYANNAEFIVNQGWWAQSVLAQDIWKRHGVPFLSLQELGDIVVAGEHWTPPRRVMAKAAPARSAAP